MALKTKSLNKPLNKRDFMNQVWSLTTEFNKIQARFDNKVSILAKKYLASNCDFKINDVINIKDSPDGFTQFKILKLIPDIKWADQLVRVKALGIMSGEGVKDAEKMIWLDELKKSGPASEVEAMKQADEKQGGL